MDTKESVTKSLDASGSGLYDYLPYILQDIDELGTSADAVINLIRSNNLENDIRKIIDLGCGKGAVSIMLASILGCECLGIDGMEAFIGDANKSAIEKGVSNLCRFESNDIRNLSYDKEFNAAILGAVGNVFGTFESTLTGVKRFIKDNGYIILDDAYIPDESSYQNTNYLNKSNFYKTIELCGLDIIEENIFDKESLEDSDDEIFNSIIKRCNELKEKHPNKSALFDSYIASQEKENNALENELVCGVFLLKAC